jgi:aryl-alcohol dehydrogenase-like predicted oxidoreductase
VYGNRGGSERFLGEILRGRRDEVVLATKFGADMGTGQRALGSRRHLVRALEESLRRLQTDYIDLYQLHRPDPRTPLEETLAALDEVVKAGKVRYVGSSNLPAWQISHAEWVARITNRTRFVSAQNQFNLLEGAAEADLLAACSAYGIGILPYFPLASGLLTGKYRRGQAPPPGTRFADRSIREDTFDRLEALASFATERGHTLLELAFAGLLATGQVASVIAGAMTAEQVKANVQAGEWKLEAGDAEELRALVPATFRTAVRR